MWKVKEDCNEITTYTQIFDIIYTNFDDLFILVV